MNIYAINHSKKMNRRRFIAKIASFLLASLFGSNLSSKVLAFAHPRLALIIDDIGPSVSKARLFSSFGIPMTFAVLPRFTRSEDLALQFRDEGHEIMLHQPMEPRDPGLDPGPGALYVGDSQDRIVEVMEENISSLPFAAGVNNHMGSRYTAYQKEMHQTLQIVKERGLFFVDSLTSSDSKGYKTAKRLHLPAACRNVFLDNHLEVEAIFRQLQDLARCGLKYGYGIGIGHPFPETAVAIGLFLDKVRNSEFEFVRVSELVTSP